MSELGVSAGSLELVTPVEYWDVNSSTAPPRPCVEVHIHEIGALVSNDTLYRDSEFMVLMPGDMDYMTKVLSHVRGLTSYGVDPWDFMRRHLSVSYYFKIYFEILLLWS